MSLKLNVCSLFFIIVFTNSVAAAASTDTPAPVTQVKSILESLALFERDVFIRIFPKTADRPWESTYTVSRIEGGGVRIGFLRRLNVCPPGNAKSKRPDTSCHPALVGTKTSDPKFEKSVVFIFEPNGENQSVWFNGSDYGQASWGPIGHNSHSLLHMVAIQLEQQLQGIPAKRLPTCGAYIFRVLTGRIPANNAAVLNQLCPW